MAWVLQQMQARVPRAAAYRGSSKGRYSTNSQSASDPWDESCEDSSSAIGSAGAEDDAADWATVGAGGVCDDELLWARSCAAASPSRPALLMAWRWFP